MLIRLFIFIQYTNKKKEEEISISTLVITKFQKLELEILEFEKTLLSNKFETKSFLSKN